jgi:Chaperone of endosialidase
MKKVTIIMHLVFALIAFTVLTSAPSVQAVSPPPDGGYPGGNTAEGQNALLSLSTGGYNTAVGFLSLSSEMAGSFNTGVGAGALLLNVGDPSTGDGMENTAIGAAALLNNATGYFNTANGAFALFNNTTGFYNTAIGKDALINNTTGNHNGANDDNALASNTTGSFNTATGHQAMASNTTGNNNTATGIYSLFNNNAGNANTADGFFALGNSTGTFNIGFGVDAGCKLTSGNNNIFIGSFGVDTESDTIRIGREVQDTDCGGFAHPPHAATFIAGINGTPVVGDPVVVDANGQLGTATSSARFKKNIKPMDTASDAILAFNPVTFQYKNDAKDTPQFGLIAEEVAKVNPDLVVRDRNGEIYSVRYEAVNAMLLNEFLKEHEKVQAQQATIARLEKQVEALAAGLQKVNAQLGTTKPTLQTASR